MFALIYRTKLFWMLVIILYSLFLIFSSKAQQQTNPTTTNYANLPQGSAILEINNIPNDVNIKTITLSLPNANNGFDQFFETGPIKGGSGTHTFNFRHNLSGLAMYIVVQIQQASTENTDLHFKGLCSITRPEPNKTNINIVQYSFDIPPNPPKTPQKPTETTDPTKSGKLLKIKEIDSQGNVLGNCYLEKFELTPDQGKS